MESIHHVFQQRQHMLLEDYEIYHYKDSRELHVSLHFHDFYECYLLLSGNIRYQIDSASFTILPGDLLLIGPNQLHRPLFTQTDKPYERIVLWLSRAFVERLSTPESDLSACFSAQRLSANRLTQEQRESITRQLFTLLNSTNAEQFGRDVLCRSLVTSLLVTLNRALAGRERALPRTDIRVSVLVKTVSSYLDAHLAEPISLDELSQTVFLSKYYLERVFRRETGVSIYQMLLQKRMIHARNLMRDGLSLTLVAQKCGFSEYSGFYKAFKNEYGISPREYAAKQ
ncbi:MAG TPA: AraC family transcriptional regulator [Feifaniaceae bacterium]|nr:AraC family transcriptional regulator [Feifaniaceae bacterium]